MWHKWFLLPSPSNSGSNLIQKKAHSSLEYTITQLATKEITLVISFGTFDSAPIRQGGGGSGGGVWGGGGLKLHLPPYFKESRLTYT